MAKKKNTKQKLAAPSVPEIFLTEDQYYKLEKALFDFGGGLIRDAREKLKHAVRMRTYSEVSVVQAAEDLSQAETFAEVMESMDILFMLSDLKILKVKIEDEP